jgi:NADH-quinone oxidoreductase subunit J
VAAIAAVAIGVLVVGVILATTWPGVTALAWTHTTDLAKRLFGDFVLPFEMVSVLLTAAVIGGVLLARRDPKREEDRS